MKKNYLFERKQKVRVPDVPANQSVKSKIKNWSGTYGRSPDHAPLEIRTVLRRSHNDMMGENIYDLGGWWYLESQLLLSNITATSPYQQLLFDLGGKNV